MQCDVAQDSQCAPYGANINLKYFGKVLHVYGTEIGAVSSTPRHASGLDKAIPDPLSAIRC